MKVAVVTGSLGGIGSAAVAALERADFAVYGVDRDDPFPTLERLDALVCAHGISGRRFGDGPVDTCTEAGWDTVLDANLKTVFLYAKQAIPLLRANGGGAIVTVSSALGLVGGDSDFATHAYAASKAGLIGLTRAMAVTYATDGYSVQRRGARADRDADERACSGRPGDRRASCRATAADGRLRLGRGCCRCLRVPGDRTVRHGRRPDGQRRLTAR